MCSWGKSNSSSTVTRYGNLSWYSNSLLIWATLRSDLDLVTVLVSADPDIQEKDGCKAMWFAMYSIHFEQYDDDEHLNRLIEVVNVLQEASK